MTNLHDDDQHLDVSNIAHFYLLNQRHGGTTILVNIDQISEVTQSGDSDRVMLHMNNGNNYEIGMNIPELLQLLSQPSEVMEIAQDPDVFTRRFESE